MIKRITVLSIILMCLVPLPAFASQILSTTGSIFKGGLEKISSSTYRIQFNRDGLYKAVITAYDDSGFSNEAFQKVFTAPDGWRFVGITDIRCNKYYKLDYYDKSGTLQGSMKLKIDDLEKPTCDSNAGDKDVYEPGEIGEVGGGSGGGCDSCKVFECPGWGKFMGKLDEIKNAIPPPPNWQQVANIFRDTIAPQIKQDMADVIGRAPEPPEVPVPTVETPKVPDMPEGIDDHGINEKRPEGKEDPKLGDSSFNFNDIQNEAPIIQEREDPTGGFKIDDPISKLPDLPDGNPMPGKDAGEWGKNKPKEQDTTMPKPPKEGDIEITKPPKPKDDGGKPPTPGDDSGSPPKPDDGGGKPPKPDDVTIGGNEYYKPKP